MLVFIYWDARAEITGVCVLQSMLNEMDNHNDEEE